ncbi:MAG: hypothetical protein PHN64_05780 [Desulfovibrionaceae bacterium]|nr:hypothetical protein [Desulfovibrionaceae bacterium]
MERNTYSQGQLTLSPVTDFSTVTGASFFTGDEDIDDFFWHDAAQHYRDGMAVTYSLCHEHGQRPLALVSLQNDAIRLTPEARTRLGYPYRSTPAVKIGRLGVQQDLQGARHRHSVA